MWRKEKSFGISSSRRQEIATVWSAFAHFPAAKKFPAPPENSLFGCQTSALPCICSICFILKFFHLWQELNTLPNFHFFTNNLLTKSDYNLLKNLYHFMPMYIVAKSVIQSYQSGSPTILLSNFQVSQGALIVMQGILQFLESWWGPFNICHTLTM